MTFTLVTGRIPKICVLTFVPITDTVSVMGLKHVFELIPTEIKLTYSHLNSLFRKESRALYPGHQDLLQNP